MTRRSMRAQVAVAGVGETTYYRHGRADEPEFVLCLKAILAACEDAGINPREIDGFASYSNDRNDPPALATALMSCASPACSGAVAAAVAPARWPMRPRQSRPGLPTASWSTGRWRRASSAASAR